MRKAQVTLFIIIGLVALLSFAGFIAYKTGLHKKILFWMQPTDVQVYVEKCLDQELERGLVEVGMARGESVDAIFANVSYSLDGFDSLIASYVISSMPSCIEDFKAFPKYSIESGEMSAQITLTDNAVLAKLDWPLLINQSNKLKSLTTFRAEKSIRLKEMIKTAKHIQQSRRYNLTYLDSIPFNTTIYTYPGFQAVVLEDASLKIRGEAYRLGFAVDR